MAHRLAFGLILLTACGSETLPLGGRDASVATDALASDSAPTDATIRASDASTPDATPDASVADAGREDGGGCDPAVVAPPLRCGAGALPDRPTEAWMRTSTGLVVVTQGSARHRCIDLVVNPGQEQILIGKFAYGALDKDLKGEAVEIWLQDPTCTWQELGPAVSSDEGQYGTVGGVEDDGGRVFFTVPVAARPGVGTYAIRMRVKGDHSEANCNLFVWPSGTHAVVSDLDGTITTRESDGFTTLFDPSAPTPHPSAPEAFSAWASKNYRVIYLTARPEMFTNGTSDWLAAHGFPLGVLHLSQSNFGELGSAAIDYKAAYLEGVARDEGVILDGAYGNKDTDLAAYMRAGVEPSTIRLFGFDGDLMGAERIDDYAPEVSRVECLPVASQP